MSRRQAILLAGAAAVLPTLVPVSPLGAVEPPHEGRFVAPDAPLILTRTLRRGLIDGKEVVTRRRYEVQIVPEKAGFRVDGRLLDAHVEAPPELAALAEIERARPDSGLFPMRLDRTGMIVPNGMNAAAGARGRASAVAASVIAGSSLGEAEKAAANAFVEQARTSGLGANPIPGDLFRPRQGRRVERREVALPDGQFGEIRVEVEARTDYDGGMLESFEQKVVTELKGSRRTNSERWTLSRADARSR